MSSIRKLCKAEDHQLQLENFYAPAFPQMGHWNSVLCSRLNLDSTDKIEP